MDNLVNRVKSKNQTDESKFMKLFGEELSPRNNTNNFLKKLNK